MSKLSATREEIELGLKDPGFDRGFVATGTFLDQESVLISAVIRLLSAGLKGDNVSTDEEDLQRHSRSLVWSGEGQIVRT